MCVCVVVRSVTLLGCAGWVLGSGIGLGLGLGLGLGKGLTVGRAYACACMYVRACMYVCACMYLCMYVRMVVRSARLFEWAGRVHAHRSDGYGGGKRTYRSGLYACVRGLNSDMMCVCIQVCVCVSEREYVSMCVWL